MSQTLTLPDELFDKLTEGAAHRGLTLEALLTILSNLVALPARPTKRDRERSRRIEQLFARYRTGSLAEQDHAELDQLIDADYQAALRRADGLIASQQSRSRPRSSAGATAKPSRPSPRPTTRSRK